MPLIRPWLAGVLGFLVGTGLYSFDTAMEFMSLDEKALASAPVDSKALVVSLELVEFLIVGPGVGALCFLVTERLHRARRDAEERVRVERERRLIMLGHVAASVAHEVRNPLHTLRLVFDELDREMPALRDHGLHVHIRSSLERIDHAVDLVYQLARPGAEEDSATDLVGVLHGVLATLAIRLGKPDLVAVGPMPERITVRCTPPALRIMVDNLIRNAVEAAGGATVQTTIAADGAVVKLHVSNPGQMPPDLCDADGRPVAKSTTKTGGLGIGLSITTQLAEAAGGTIRLRSDAGMVTATLALPA